MIYVTSSKIKSNFGKYLDLVLSEGEVTIVRHKRPIVRMVAVTVPKIEEVKETNRKEKGK